MLDLFDCATKKAVNSPNDFEFIPITCSVSNTGPLVSWEATHGRPCDGITNGEERCSVEEGSSWTLKWRGGHFTFTGPVRTTPHPLPVPYVS